MSTDDTPGRRHGLAVFPFLCAGLLLRLALTGQYRNFVRPSMGRWVLLAGVFFAVVAARTLRSAASGHAHGTDEADAAPHAHRLGAAWLLILPLAALLLVTPGPLESYAVGRNASAAATTGHEYVALPTSTEPLTMKIHEFYGRAYDRDGVTLVGHDVELTGFISDHRSPDGHPVLVRFSIFCCAADAIAAVVTLVGGPEQELGTNEWVTVRGRFDRVSDKLPRLIVAELSDAPTPTDPYE